MITTGLNALDTQKKKNMCHHDAQKIKSKKKPQPTNLYAGKRILLSLLSGSTDRYKDHIYNLWPIYKHIDNFWTDQEIQPKS